MGIPKGLELSKQNWGKTKQETYLPDFRLYRKATVIKTADSIGTKIDIGQGDRRASLEINPHIYCQSVTKAVTIINGEKTVSSTKAGQHVHQWNQNIPSYHIKK